MNVGPQGHLSGNSWVRPRTQHGPQNGGGRGQSGDLYRQYPSQDVVRGAPPTRSQPSQNGEGNRIQNRLADAEKRFIQDRFQDDNWQEIKNIANRLFEAIQEGQVLGQLRFDDKHDPKTPNDLPNLETYCVQAKRLISNRHFNFNGYNDYSFCCYVLGQSYMLAGDYANGLIWLNEINPRAVTHLKNDAPVSVNPDTITENILSKECFSFHLLICELRMAPGRQVLPSEAVITFNNAMQKYPTFKSLGVRFLHAWVNSQVRNQRPVFVYKMLRDLIRDSNKVISEWRDIAAQVLSPTLPKGKSENFEFLSNVLAVLVRFRSFSKAYQVYLAVDPKTLDLESFKRLGTWIGTVACNHYWRGGPLGLVRHRNGLDDLLVLDRYVLDRFDWSKWGIGRGEFMNRLYTHLAKGFNNLATVYNKERKLTDWQRFKLPFMLRTFASHFFCETDTGLTDRFVRLDSVSGKMVVSPPITAPVLNPNFNYQLTMAHYDALKKIVSNTDQQTGLAELARIASISVFEPDFSISHRSPAALLGLFEFFRQQHEDPSPAAGVRKQVDRQFDRLKLALPDWKVNPDGFEGVFNDGRITDALRNFIAEFACDSKALLDRLYGLELEHKPRLLMMAPDAHLDDGRPRLALLGLMRVIQAGADHNIQQVCQACISKPNHRHLQTDADYVALSVLARGNWQGDYPTGWDKAFQTKWVKDVNKLSTFWKPNPPEFKSINVKMVVDFMTRVFPNLWPIHLKNALQNSDAVHLVMTELLHRLFVDIRNGMRHLHADSVVVDKNSLTSFFTKQVETIADTQVLRHLLETYPQYFCDWVLAKPGEVPSQSLAAGLPFWEYLETHHSVFFKMISVRSKDKMQTIQHLADRVPFFLNNKTNGLAVLNTWHSTLQSNAPERTKLNTILTIGKQARDRRLLESLQRRVGAMDLARHLNEYENGTDFVNQLVAKFNGTALSKDQKPAARAIIISMLGAHQAVVTIDEAEAVLTALRKSSIGFDAGQLKAIDQRHIRVGLTQDQLGNPNELMKNAITIALRALDANLVDVGFADLGSTADLDYDMLRGLCNNSNETLPGFCDGILTKINDHQVCVQLSHVTTEITNLIRDSRDFSWVSWVAHYLRDPVFGLHVQTHIVETLAAEPIPPSLVENHLAVLPDVARFFADVWTIARDNPLLVDRINRIRLIEGVPQDALNDDTRRWTAIVDNVLGQSDVEAHIWRVKQLENRDVNGLEYVNLLASLAGLSNKQIAREIETVLIQHETQYWLPGHLGVVAGTVKTCADLNWIDQVCEWTAKRPRYQQPITETVIAQLRFAPSMDNLCEVSAAHSNFLLELKGRTTDQNIWSLIDEKRLVEGISADALNDDTRRWTAIVDNVLGQSDVEAHIWRVKQLENRDVNGLEYVNLLASLAGLSNKQIAREIETVLIQHETQYWLPGHLDGVATAIQACADLSWIDQVCEWTDVRPRYQQHIIKSVIDQLRVAQSMHKVCGVSAAHSAFLLKLKDLTTDQNIWSLIDEKRLVEEISADVLNDDTQRWTAIIKASIRHPNPVGHHWRVDAVLGRDVVLDYEDLLQFPSIHQQVLNHENRVGFNRQITTLAVGLAGGTPPEQVPQLMDQVILALPRHQNKLWGELSNWIGETGV